MWLFEPVLLERENALKFIRSYAAAHAILLPGRIPGYKRDDLQLLPSATAKRFMFILKHQMMQLSSLFQALHDLYEAAAEAMPIRAVSYKLFCKLWRTLLAHITVIKPTSGVPAELHSYHEGCTQG